MTKFMTAGAAALATSLALGTAAIADTTPDLRGVWSASYTTVSPDRAFTGEGPRFNQAEWTLEIAEQQGNVFWGPSKWRRDGDTEWTEYQATGSIRMDGSNAIGIVETAPSISGANGLIDARYEDGKIYADFRSLRSGTTYSTVLERVAS